MRLKGGRRFAPIVWAAGALILVACADDTGQLTPPGPQFAGGPDPSCNFKAAIAALKDYFPGSGKGSVQAQALDILDMAAAACEVPDAVGYASEFFNMASFIEAALQAGSTGDPADGALLVWELLTIESPAGGPIFKPCGAADGVDCWTWDPDITDIQAELVAALSDGGAWAVVSGTGNDAVCSGHRSGPAGSGYECDIPDPSVTGDVWGANPMRTWNGTLAGRTSLLFGSELSATTSPTGEALLAAGVPAYTFNLIPHPEQFPAADEMIVGLCSTAIATEEGVIQREGTSLQPANLDWCGNQSFTRSEGSLFGRLARFGWELVDPTPRPLWAAALIRGSPGGAAGSFSEFFAIDVNPDAFLVFVVPPADATENTPQDITILARTDQFTPLEQVLLTVYVKDQNGLIPSGGSLEGPGCDIGGNSCSLRTQGDEQGQPGTATFSLTLNKTGAYRFCVTGELDPFVFQETCSGPINVRPH